MKKILSADQIRQTDAYTIEHEPVSSLLLMERAARSCFLWLRNHMASYTDPVIIFCGTGNNGGDGLVIADYLLSQQIKVMVYVVRYSDQCSSDFLINEERLVKNYPGCLFNVYKEEDLPTLSCNNLIIDAIFGTGLNKAPQDIAAQTIKHINSAGAEVIAIDMPSGLFADISSAAHSEKIIRARHTLTFQLKKLCFYFPQSYVYCGEVHEMDIGLHPNFLSTSVTHYFETDKKTVQQYIKTRNIFSHKGNYGHALLMCGSYGKMGAAVLSSKACLRSGVGLLTANVPLCGYSIMQTAVPEAMVITDDEEQVLSNNFDVTKFNAIGIGCGIGHDVLTIKMMRHLLTAYHQPMVIDADALNILAQHKELLHLLPANSILTPHFKEFARLTKDTHDDFERNALQLEFSLTYNCFVLLKGKYSCISTPDGNCFFNPTGNAGMATGGSGDVLTGVLTGLLAQGYSPFEACVAGAYLHGAAGDLAAEKSGMESMIAGDIIDQLGNAFLNFH